MQGEFEEDGEMYNPAYDEVSPWGLVQTWTMLTRYHGAD